ncbi:MAG: type II secretion system protein GspG [Acidobacteriota bacterium]
MDPHQETSPTSSDRPAAGFTLMELLVVVAVVGILASMVIPAMTAAMEKSRQRTTMANMRSIGNQLQIYQNDESLFPGGSLTIQELAAALLPVSRTGIPTRDAWLHDFDYRSDGLTSYTVESFGRDGVPGADISLSQASNFDLDLVLSDGQFIAAVN